MATTSALTKYAGGGVSRGFGGLTRANVTAQALAGYRKSAERALSLAAKVRQRGESLVEEGIRTVTTVGSAGGFGFVQGRYGEISVLGIPLEIIAGLGSHAVGFLELFGRHSWHFHNVGTGALAAFAVTSLRGYGLSRRSKVSGDTEDGRRGMTAGRSLFERLRHQR